MKSKSRLVSMGLALGALAFTGALSSDANACGGAWVPYMMEVAPDDGIDHRPAAIAKAEKALEKGDHAAAAGYVLRAMPHVRQLDAKKAKIVERAQHVLAVATARSDGELRIENQVPAYARGDWGGKTTQAKQKNLKWSIATLRGLQKAKKTSDPTLQTELGEALARVDEHQAEARKLLETLAKKDLIATPEGYAVLAELRAKAGDQKGKKLAVSRCEAMTKQPAVCRVSRTG